MLSWEAHQAAPDARLRPGVLSYTGYAEHAPGPMRRLEVPFAGIPMIVSLGPSLLVDGVRHRSFVAGLDDTATVTEYTGDQSGIQVDLTPLAARRLLGRPMSELARQVVALEMLEQRELDFGLIGDRGEGDLASLPLSAEPRA